MMLYGIKRSISCCLFFEDEGIVIYCLKICFKWWIFIFEDCLNVVIIEYWLMMFYCCGILMR